MKKFLALALSCSLALTALAGCSGSGSGTPGSSAPESGDKVVTIGIFEPCFRRQRCRRQAGGPGHEVRP